MTPSLSAKVGIFKCLAKPVDGGKEFKNGPLFGSHKTWRGIILGPAVGTLVVFFQAWLFSKSSFIREISFFDYQKINLLFFAFLITLGAICGDLFFAFIKRRLRLEPGARFFPFDQINYVIGASLFLTPMTEINIDIKAWITLLLLTPLLHIIATQLGFILGLSRSKW